ncbi:MULTISPECIES: PadR family transcriptional regulator [unclassified Sphingomonas]|uniref:PadR family transcriptional regulator n=1 Tax=unclassified Sphingomonas TaxID=196159 RepID=UPI00082CF021|nr:MULTISPECIES: PadR family transcriptional regulator [unclassified Sphingomonas]MCH4891528.1 PadR family transcriptional regulator [Sphingomonas sp. SFZ2018-12]
MTRTRSFSPAARRVLAALLDKAGSWSYGYDLAKITGIKSGTLYPLLIRLEERGLLETEWQPPAETGRPPRHIYRLTAAGIEVARANPIVPAGADRSSLREVRI